MRPTPEDGGPRAGSRRRPSRPALRLAGLALLVSAGLAATACSRTPPPALPVAGLEPWEVPAAAWGTQRLFRARFEGPEGGGGFRMAVRMAGPGRYQAVASDPFGRRLWSLEVADGGGVFLDHRRDSACRFEGELALEGEALLPIPVEAFPALLLGRLPERPAAPARRDGETLRFRGEDGRRWRVEMEGAEVVSWTLSEGGRPLVWWERRGGEAILSDRERGVQLRWRETAAEELASPLEPFEIPPGYRDEICGSIDPGLGELGGDAGPVGDPG